MASRILSGAILLLAIVTGSAPSDQDSPLKAALGDDVFQRCGLDLDPRGEVRRYSIEERY